VDELVTAQVGDLDEHRRAIRVRSEVEKNERYAALQSPRPASSKGSLHYKRT
jgi:hypothetical protein